MFTGRARRVQELPSPGRTRLLMRRPVCALTVPLAAALLAACGSKSSSTPSAATTASGPATVTVTRPTTTPVPRPKPSGMPLCRAGRLARRDARRRGHRWKRKGWGLGRSGTLPRTFPRRSAKRSVRLAYGQDTPAYRGSSTQATQDQRVWCACSLDWLSPGSQSVTSLPSGQP